MPREQADTLVSALGDVVEESIKGFERSLVSREEGERWRYSQKVRMTLKMPAMYSTKEFTLDDRSILQD